MPARATTHFLGTDSKRRTPSADHIFARKKVKRTIGSRNMGVGRRVSGTLPLLRTVEKEEEEEVEDMACPP